MQVKTLPSTKMFLFILKISKKDVKAIETLIKYLLISFLEVFNFECKYFV